MRRDLEQQPREAVERNPHMTLEQIRQAAYGPWEFHSEKWELAYIKRIDATIAALKSAGVPVIWVGLPSQRGTKSSEDSSYLNELYRSRAEKAGIVFVNIWDGFVDEVGRYSAQGPDYEGQIRRLRIQLSRRERRGLNRRVAGHVYVAARDAQGLTRTVTAQVRILRR